MASVDLGKQYGPLPLGAWVIVVGGGLGIAYYTRKAGTGTVATVVDDTSGEPGVGTGPGWIAVTPPTTGPVTADNAPVTNEEWGVKAINYLIAQGYDPAEADEAIRIYLNGGTALNMAGTAYTYSLKQRAMIALALGHLGAPPVPLPPGPGLPPLPTPAPTPTPTPKPKPPPPKKNPPPPPSVPRVRYYTVVRGDTLWGIATRYYGSGFKWPTIFNANIRGKTRADGSPGLIINPNLIYPGQRFIIP